MGKDNKGRSRSRRGVVDDNEPMEVDRRSPSATPPPPTQPRELSPMCSPDKLLGLKKSLPYTLTFDDSTVFTCLIDPFCSGCLKSEVIVKYRNDEGETEMKKVIETEDTQDEAKIWHIVKAMKEEILNPPKPEKSKYPNSVPKYETNEFWDDGRPAGAGKVVIKVYWYKRGGLPRFMEDVVDKGLSQKQRDNKAKLLRNRMIDNKPPPEPKRPSFNTEVRADGKKYLMVEVLGVSREMEVDTDMSYADLDLEASKLKLKIRHEKQDERLQLEANIETRQLMKTELTQTRIRKKVKAEQAIKKTFKKSRIGGVKQSVDKYEVKV